MSVQQLATMLSRTTFRWRKGLKGWLEGDFAWVRVWPAHRWRVRIPAAVIPDLESSARWLLVEWRRDGTVKYALSNLPADTPLKQAVAWWKERWPIERCDEQRKKEVGLDHFEGRSWTEFHHHAATRPVCDRLQGSEPDDRTELPAAHRPGRAPHRRADRSAADQSRIDPSRAPTTVDPALHPPLPLLPSIHERSYLTE
ncbi:MAG: hypothetical protein ACKVVP_00280 [Chloroflexota bacterium]